MDSHDASHPMLATPLTGFAQIQEGTWCSINTSAGRIRGADEFQ
jgi:hypothetical protein